MEKINGSILENTPVATGFHRMQIHCPSIADACRAGQFLMLKIAGQIDPYLGRPFAIAWTDRQLGTVQILFKVQGDGTARIAELQKGDEVVLVGPLGNGYDLSLAKNRALLVAGGSGTASILSAAKALVDAGKQVTAIIGTESKDTLAGYDKLTALGVETRVATMDGSFGEKGFPTPLVTKALDAGHTDVVYCCGPMPMMRAVSELACGKGVPCQVSLEKHMGCGFGVCLACSCKTVDQNGKKGLKRVCCEGPVFHASEVDWDG